MHRIIAQVVAATVIVRTITFYGDVEQCCHTGIKVSSVVTSIVDEIDASRLQTTGSLEQIRLRIRDLI